MSGPPSNGRPRLDQDGLYETDFDEIPLRDLSYQPARSTPAPTNHTLRNQSSIQSLNTPYSTQNLQPDSSDSSNPFLNPHENDSLNNSALTPEHHNRLSVLNILNPEPDTLPSDSNTSSIFPDNQTIDLARGLRDALGDDGWLTRKSVNYSSSFPDSQYNPSNEDTHNSQIRTPVPRLSSESGRVSRSPSRTRNANSIIPTQGPNLSIDPNHLSASRFSGSFSPNEPTTPTDMEREIGFFSGSPLPSRDSQSSPGPQITRPLSPRANFSRAVQKFSNRIITGDTKHGPESPSRESSHRPFSMNSYTGGSNDDDNLTILAPRLPPKVPLRPTSQSNSNAVGDMTSPLLSDNSQVAAQDDGALGHKGVNTHDDNFDVHSIPQSPISPYTSDMRFSMENVSLNSATGSENRFSSSAGVLTDEFLTQDTSYPSAPLQPQSSQYQPDPPKPRVELVGTSLFIFKKDNKFRLFLYHMLSHKWIKIAFALVLFLHLAVLTGLTVPDVYEKQQHMNNAFLSDRYVSVLGWMNLGIFVFYTLYTVSSIIAYGLIFDSKNETVHISFRNKRYRILTMPSTRHNSFAVTGVNRPANHIVDSVRNVLKNDADNNAVYNGTLDPSNNVVLAPERAYLRSTWTRIDTIAIISYWISAILQLEKTADKLELYLFYTLSGLPILRLLNFTKRTSIILRSLKAGSTRLFTIFLFIAFFLTLFSIIGSQSFHESLSRTCVWINPNNSSDTYNNNLLCGSYIEPTNLTKMAFLDRDGKNFVTAKGYTCPVYSQCQTGDSLNNNTLNFDNFLNSLEIVFVVLSMNTFSDIMYNIIDAENSISCLFFIFGIIILAYGLASLFISIIASTFKVIRQDIDSSYDTDTRIERLLEHRKAHEAHICRTKLGAIYYYLREIPLLVILVELFVQCTVTRKTSPETLFTIYIWEIWVSAFFALEIILRFVLYLPKVRYFFMSKFNIVDLFLAIANVITILPWIHNHPELYQWLTVFQIVRFYRVVLAIEYIREMWIRVVGQARMIFDVTLFYYTFIYIASILGCLLLQGVIPTPANGGGSVWTFQTLGNSFIAMYIISSTENWSEIMYNAIEFTDSTFARACVGVFFCAWLIMSNFVTINMFIAVLSENLEPSIMSKRMEQIFIFFKEEIRNQAESPSGETKDGLKVFLRYLTPRSNRSEDYKAVFEKVVVMLKDSNFSNFLSSDSRDQLNDSSRSVELDKNEGSLARLVLIPWEKIHKRFSKKSPEVNTFRDLEEYIGHLRAVNEQEQEQIRKDPNYNKSLRIFPVENKIRKLCQKLVSPSYGVRFEGQIKPTIFWSIVWVFMIAATIGLIVVAVVVTPIYYIENLEGVKYNWYVITEAVFLAIFTTEVIIKVIADGLLYAPNAYLKSVWGIIDFFVWISLVANFIQEVKWGGQSARIIRSFKALRALRLLTINARAQDLFNNVVIKGVWKLFSAAIIAFSLLFPFSVWGLNIFKGRMFSCNDSSLNGSLDGCVGEFMNTPFNWEVKSPRVVANSYYDFDTFGSSLLILFEIISLEGWVDVLQSAMSITGPFNQPSFHSSNFRGAFFIVYNTLSTIFIMTLFLSVIIQNYSKSTGTSCYTDKQRMWYELEKSLKTVRPSIRPDLQKGTYREKLFKQFTTFRSNIHLVMFGLLLGIIVVLISEYYPHNPSVYRIRMVILLVLIIFYFAFVLLKVYAFGWKRYFRRKWDAYAFFITVISLAFKIADFFVGSYTFLIAEKLFYVGMIVLIIPYSRRLDQLLKTAAASLPNMSHLLLVWLVLYFAYGIALNQIFGLTKIGPNGSLSINFRTVPNALILLFRMSCGEGWNQVLDDFTVERPLCYRQADGNDCGSQGYAYVLFISWNIISLFIFANILVSMIFEQFSYLARPEEPPIDRDKIRTFKDAWRRFDKKSRGYIHKSDLMSFMFSLDGYFSMRIHREPWSLQSIISDSNCMYMDQIDLQALRKHMKKYPRYEIAQRRERCDQFYYHAMELADNAGNIGFHSLLLLFPFYNDIDYNECLSIRDYLHYTKILTKIRQKQREDKNLGYKKMVLEMLKLQKALRDQGRKQYEREAGLLIPKLRIDNVDSDEEKKNGPFESSEKAQSRMPTNQTETDLLLRNDESLNNSGTQDNGNTEQDHDDLYDPPAQQYFENAYSSSRPFTAPTLRTRSSRPTLSSRPITHGTVETNNIGSEIDAHALASPIDFQYDRDTANHSAVSLGPSYIGSDQFGSTLSLPHHDHQASRPLLGNPGAPQAPQEEQEERRVSLELHQDPSGFADLNSLASYAPGLPPKNPVDDLARPKPDTT